MSLPNSYTPDATAAADVTVNSATALDAPCPDLTTRRIAYFSMEIALDPKIPTYSGGLGMLAGDTLRQNAPAWAETSGNTIAVRR